LFHDFYERLKCLGGFRFHEVSILVKAFDYAVFGEGHDWIIGSPQKSFDFEIILRQNKRLIKANLPARDWRKLDAKE